MKYSRSWNTFFYESEEVLEMDLFSQFLTKLIFSLSEFESGPLYLSPQV
jgi:hypothetical protein